MPVATGTRLDGHEILGPLGAGGMVGRVHDKPVTALPLHVVPNWTGELQRRAPAK
jgi:hypothetical protein